MNITTQNGCSLRQLEGIEAAYWQRYYQQAGYQGQVHAAMACALPQLDALAFNRVVGLGQGKANNPEALEDIIHFYQRAGVPRFMIQLPPQLVDELTACVLESKGFVHHNNWSKLVRDTSPFETANNTSLTIEKLTPDNAAVFGEIIYDCFDWEGAFLPDFLSAPVGQKGYTHFAACYKGKPIAVAALYVEGDMEAMAFAGTRKEYRGLGAQTLLLKTRIDQARKLGARWVCAETGQHFEDKPVKSYQNMLKVGFELTYQRQNWLYTF